MISFRCISVTGWIGENHFLMLRVDIFYWKLDLIGSYFSDLGYCRTGSKSGASSRCHSCQGSGIKITTRQIGLGMIQQMQHSCPECKGSGDCFNLLYTSCFLSYMLCLYIIYRFLVLQGR